MMPTSEYKDRDNLRNNITSSGALTTLALVSFLCGFLCALFGEFVFPLYCASLAALFLYDKYTKRVLSVSLCVIVIVLNILLGSYIPTAVVFAPFAALVLSFTYKKGISKGECAGYMTAICSLMIVVGVFFFAMLAVKELSFTAAIEYFKAMYQNISDEIISFVEEAASSVTSESVPTEFSEETVSLLLSSLVLVIPSLVVIIGFLLSGLTCKIFCFIVSRFSDKPELIVNWRFSTGSIFAYFYIVVVIFSALVGAYDVFGIALANVQNVYMFVYAYIGFNYARFILSLRRSSFFSTVVLVAVIVALSSFAISILSFLGVYFTVIKNKQVAGGGNAV